MDARIARRRFPSCTPHVPMMRPTQPMLASLPDYLEDAQTHDTLAAVAHDLRLPLSHIKGFVSSLRRDDVDWDEDTRREFLAEIELETDRLTEMVESLLARRARTVSRPSRVSLAFAEPSAVVRGALHRVRGFIGNRQLRIDVAPDLPLVRMDARQMERVLANLLQNALKYTPWDTAIGIAARMTARNELEFMVEDEGPGVSIEDRERIFEPLFRSTRRHSNVPGNGLGLAICQSIVLAHGGSMQLTDRPGGGARFSVLLPARVCLVRDQVQEQGTQSCHNNPSRR